MKRLIPLIAMLGAFLVPSVADAKPRPSGDCTTNKGVTTCTTSSEEQLLYSEDVSEGVGHCSYDGGPWGGEPGTLTSHYRRDYYGTTTTTTTYKGNKQTGQSTSSTVTRTEQTAATTSCEPGAFQGP